MKFNFNKNNMKKLISLAVCLFTVSTLCAQTEVIAHRGFHATKNSVRNSLSALQHAQDLGVFGSECDVNETKDGTLIVVHGPKHGPYNKVQDTHYALLRAIPLTNGEKVPTFDEYLAQAKKNTKTKLIIELKSHDTPERETRVVKKAIAAVKKHKLSKKEVEYIAFSKHMCDELVKYAPKGTKIAYLSGNLTPQQCKDAGYTGIDYNYGVMQKHPEWIKECHDLGLTVNIWTVNDTKGMQWCIDNGADYITTDNPMETNRLLGR